VISYFVVRT